MVAVPTSRDEHNFLVYIFTLKLTARDNPLKLEELGDPHLFEGHNWRSGPRRRRIELITQNINFWQKQFRLNKRRNPPPIQAVYKM